VARHATGNLNRDELVADDRIPVGVDLTKLKVEPGEVAIRFVFGALIAVIAGALGMVAGAKFGGMFLAFPAILPATLTLIEKKEDKTKAYLDMSGGAVGAMAMAGFAATAWLLLGRISGVAAILIALAVWVLLAVGLHVVVRVSGLYRLQDRFGPA
jgi:hypothetical protein